MKNLEIILNKLIKCFLCSFHRALQAGQSYTRNQIEAAIRVIQVQHTVDPTP